MYLRVFNASHSFDIVSGGGASASLFHPLRPPRPLSLPRQDPGQQRVLGQLRRAVNARRGPPVSRVVALCYAPFLGTMFPHACMHGQQAHRRRPCLRVCDILAASSLCGQSIIRAVRRVQFACAWAPRPRWQLPTLPRKAHPCAALVASRPPGCSSLASSRRDRDRDRARAQQPAASSAASPAAAAAGSSHAAAALEANIKNLMMSRLGCVAGAAPPGAMSLALHMPDGEDRPPPSRPLPCRGICMALCVLCIKAGRVWRVSREVENAVGQRVLGEECRRTAWHMSCKAYRPSRLPPHLSARSACSAGRGCHLMHPRVPAYAGRRAPATAGGRCTAWTRTSRSWSGTCRPMSRRPGQCDTQNGF